MLASPVVDNNDANLIVEYLPNTPMRVLILIETTLIRGAAKSLLTFLSAIAHLERSHLSISVLTFQRTDSSQSLQSNEFVEATRKLGINTYVIPERRPWDPRVLTLLKQVVTETNPHIVHTNNVKSHALVKAIGVHRASCWIAFHHGYTTTDLKMRCYNQLDRWSLRSAERVVIPCRAFTRTQLRESGVQRERIRVLQNAGTTIRTPSAEEIQATRTRLGLAPDLKVVLCVGRMSAEKGHIDLLRSMATVARTHPYLNARLVLVGSGPELPRLQAEAARVGISSRVTFATAEKDIAPLLHAADVFALPSHSEGSPHVILEAMSAGIPIVATRVGGIPEMLIDNETAVLVPPRAPEAFAAGLVRVLQSDEFAYRCATAARHAVETIFSADTYVRSVLQIYAEALAR